MMEQKKIFVFDFDGTLTKRDTFVEFIRFVHGDKATLIGFLKNLHVLLLMKAGIIGRGRARRMVFSYFFAGMTEEMFDAHCLRFATAKKNLLRPKAVKKLDSLTAERQHVIIVTESITRWVQPFFAAYIIHPGFKVTGTEIAVDNGKLTGRFANKNCTGTEKVRHIKALFPERDDCFIVAYGDGKGDIEMLDYADEGHYKPFRGRR